MDSITTHDMNDFLSQPFSREEVRTALKQMPHTKALGLDGVHAFFNQKYWRIIGRDIDNFCLDLLNGDWDMSEVNQTYFALIQKVKDPKHLSQ